MVASNRCSMKGIIEIKKSTQKIFLERLIV